MEGGREGGEYIERGEGKERMSKRQSREGEREGEALKERKKKTGEMKSCRTFKETKEKEAVYESSCQTHTCLPSTEMTG